MSLVNQKDLMQRIMSRAVVKGGVGPVNNKLSKTNVYSPTGNTRVEVPGNVVMNDIGFFNQPNPFGDRATARFTTEMQIDTQNANPFPTLFQSVILNEANTPIIAQQQMSHQEFQTVKDIAMENRAVLQSPRVGTAQIFPDLFDNVTPKSFL